MRIRIKRKKLTLLVSGIAVLALAGAALAYWTASGTGVGSASVGTDDGVTITGVTFEATMYPAAIVNVAFDVTNGSSNTAVQVDKIVADTSTYTNGVEIFSAPLATTLKPCKADWFTYSGVTIAQHIAASDTYSAAYGSGGTLTMSDSTTDNQDGCKTATIKLHLKTDNSGI
jgi:hypothetical protein